VETAKVKQCGCNNEGQDELYGSKNRVFNLTSKASQKKGEAGEYRCTVCDLKIKIIN
jgi:hypothetical protein